MSFSGRRFSINKPSGQGINERRFSTSKDPSAKYSNPRQTQERPLTSTPSELGSDIHRRFRQAHAGHRPHAGLDPSRASTGVVWCTERAYEHGLLDNPSEWANLGQGAPEVDDNIEGSFQRPKTIEVSIAGREYGPTAGIKPLRKAVADLYNAHHRVGKESQYTWENVCIVPGGRAGLIRIAAVLNNAYLGFFIPVSNIETNVE